MFITPDVHNLGYSSSSILLLTCFISWVAIADQYFIYFFVSWVGILVQFLFFDVLNLGLLYDTNVFRCFWENVPCSLLSGSMPWLFSPTSASPLGFVRSSLFLFYTSYLPILLLIIILYRKIYVITVMEGVQNGILNGRREKYQEN